MLVLLASPRWRWRPGEYLLVQNLKPYGTSKSSFRTPSASVCAGQLGLNAEEADHTILSAIVITIHHRHYQSHSDHFINGFFFSLQGKQPGE